MTIKTVIVKKNILALNTGKADEIKQQLHQKNTMMINIMSSPGSGKTTLIIETIKKLRNDIKIAVIEGDVASCVDSEKIQKLGIPAVQINTCGGCHLDAGMISEALQSVELAETDLIFIENVGNLICTAEFDLGADKKIVLLSIPEGDDKPLKYPVLFSEADAVIVTKTDVLPYFDFNIQGFNELIKGLNPDAEIFHVSAATGEGMDSWNNWMKKILTQILK